MNSVKTVRKQLNYLLYEIWLF